MGADLVVITGHPVESSIHLHLDAVQPFENLLARIDERFGQFHFAEEEVEVRDLHRGEYERFLRQGGVDLFG